MGQERQLPTPIALLLTFCNVLLAVVTLVTVTSWHVEAAVSTATSASATSLRHDQTLFTPAPVVYLVASQEQSDRLVAFLVNNAPAGMSGPWMHILVVSSDAEVAHIRQTLAARNRRRTAAGKEPIQIVDLRDHNPEPSDMKQMATSDGGL
jgi:hypothetical protein